MCVAAELRKRERQDETQFTTEIDGFLSFTFHPPPWVLMYFFAGFFLNLTLCMTKLRVLVLCLSYFTYNSNVFGNLANLNVFKKNPMLLAPCFSPQKLDTYIPLISPHLIEWTDNLCVCTNWVETDSVESGFQLSSKGFNQEIGFRV
jgi:hypothetical protein